MLNTVDVLPGLARGAAAILPAHAGGSDSGGKTCALHGEINRGMPPSSPVFPTHRTGEVGSKMLSSGNSNRSSGAGGQNTRGILSMPPPLGIRDGLECLGACHIRRGNEQP